MAAECSKCGCNDVSAGDGARRFGRSSRRLKCNHCGFAWHEDLEGAAAAVPTRAAGGRPSGTTVKHKALRCPECNSDNVKAQRTMPGRKKRYELCLDCGATFKVEIE